MIKLVLVLCFSTLALSDLQCYDCDPSDEGECKDLLNVKVTKCNDLPDDTRGLRRILTPTTNISETEKEYSCMTIYFESDNEKDKSGIYRGCVIREKQETTVTTCEFIKTNFLSNVSGTMKTCDSCTTDKCNTGGAASLIVSTAALIVGVVVCVLHF